MSPELSLPTTICRAKIHTYNQPILCSAGCRRACTGRNTGIGTWTESIGDVTPPYRQCAVHDLEINVLDRRIGSHTEAGLWSRVGAKRGATAGKSKLELMEKRL